MMIILQHLLLLLVAFTNSNRITCRRGAGTLKPAGIRLALLLLFVSAAGPGVAGVSTEARLCCCGEADAALLTRAIAATEPAQQMRAAPGGISAGAIGFGGGSITRCCCCCRLLPSPVLRLVPPAPPLLVLLLLLVPLALLRAVFCQALPI
jgi:hypothetical protein